MCKTRDCCQTKPESGVKGVAQYWSPLILPVIEDISSVCRGILRAAAPALTDRSPFISSNHSTP